MDKTQASSQTASASSGIEAIVAGVDIGPAADNHSMGVIVATKTSGVWSFEPVPRPQWDDYASPNEPYIDELSACEVIALDAPLWFERDHPTRKWEHDLITWFTESTGVVSKEQSPAELRNVFSNWKPAPTSMLYAHAWRARDLIRGLVHRDSVGSVYEVFPASWFALTHTGEQPDEWKGNLVDDLKRDCINQLFEKLRKLGLRFELSNLGDEPLHRDYLDAMPCVISAILISEGRMELLSIEPPLRQHQPSVVFPGRLLEFPDTQRELIPTNLPAWLL